MSLFVSLVSNNAEAYWNCLPKCVRILERLARNQDIPQEYTYYGIPSPWLQVLSFLVPSFIHRVLFISKVRPNLFLISGH
jgi:AP-2 complex subunit alpha